MDNVYLFIVPTEQMALTDTVFSCIPALMLDSKNQGQEELRLMPGVSQGEEGVGHGLPSGVEEEEEEGEEPLQE